MSKRKPTCTEQFSSFVQIYASAKLDFCAEHLLELEWTVHLKIIVIFTSIKVGCEMCTKFTNQWKITPAVAVHITTLVKL